MISNTVRCHVLMIIIGFSCHVAEAKISLSRIFTDNMVIQRNIQIPVWGNGAPDEAVKVLFKEQVTETTCDQAGNWKVKLKPEHAGGPYELQVISDDTITLKNVLIGDVWLCSGQSNMWRPVTDVLNAEEEIAQSDHPRIRLYSVPRTFRKEPVSDFPIPHPDEQRVTSMQWEVCSPQAVKNFSAVGYFFGREVHQSQNVPVGLIKVCWGSTKIEPWMRLASLKSIEGYEYIHKEIVDPVKVLDSVTRAYKSRIKDAADKGYRNEEAVWASKSSNADSWNKMRLPQEWEKAGLKDFDGVVWFRREFLLPDAVANSEFMLSLGEISDANKVWVNGHYIGGNDGKIPGSPYYQSKPKSKYTVDPAILSSGKNTILVRVANYIGNGGFTGSEQDLYIQSASYKQMLAGEWSYKVGVKAEGQPPARVRPHQTPTVLFNGMINPLIPYAMKGVIWYQGESNTGSPDNYSELFSTMISDWRRKWGQGDFPFLFVQLANFGEPAKSPESSSWALLREEQYKTLSVPHTGMAVTIDIGEADNIHPANKQGVGERLALVARERVYGEEIVSSGPIYKKMDIKDDKVYLSFNTFGENLVLKDRYGYVRGLAIAGADKKFYWARGYLKNNQVVVFSPSVKKPVAVRYAWSKNPGHPNLYNQGGLPAIPFRTDDWIETKETE